MSSSGPRREVAYRVFAEEFNDATHTYAESDEERAPNYLVMPTGARVNRLFVVGVLTEVEEVSDDVIRARVVDPTGAFVIYAGQYQPEALAFFERADPPAFVAVTGKARTFQPEGSDRVFTSLRPETVNQVDAGTRDRWVVQTAEQTLERVATFAKALETSLTGQELEDALRGAGVKPGLAAGIPRSIEAYGTTTGYLASIQSMAIDAARLVAGEVDAVEGADLDPDEGGDATVDTSFADDVGIEPGTEPAAETPGTRDSTAGEDAGEGGAEAEPDGSQAEAASGTPETGTEDEPSLEPDREPATPAEPPSEAQGGDDEPPAVEEADAEATDEMYELSDEEREEVKEKYDVGFESGAEIGEPESEPGDMGADEPAENGAEEAESETDGDSPVAETSVAEHSSESAEASPSTEPEPDIETGSASSDTADGATEGAVAESEPEAPTDGSEEAESSQAVEPEPEDGAGSDETPTSSDDLEDVVIETMKTEGDDDGIKRADLVAHVEAEFGAEEEDIESAIQDALLGGRCFESGEDRLKPI